jgi:hypothetical protein
MDGKIIGREELRRDVAAQLRAVGECESAFVRESLEIDGSDAVEVLRQIAWADVRVFLFARRRWNVQRKGRYVWTKTDAGWRIKEVDVLQEAVR